MPCNGNQARSIQSVNHSRGMPERRRYSDSDLPLPSARALPRSFKCGLSCCPKWCVALLGEWLDGFLTLLLGWAPLLSHRTHTHTQSSNDWREKLLSIPWAAAWALLSFSAITPNPSSHVCSGNRGHHVLLGAGNRLKDSEMIQRQTGSEWAVQTVASASIPTFPSSAELPPFHTESSSFPLDSYSVHETF